MYRPLLIFFSDWSVFWLCYGFDLFVKRISFRNSVKSPDSRLQYLCVCVWLCVSCFRRHLCVIGPPENPWDILKPFTRITRNWRKLTVSELRKSLVLCVLIPAIVKAVLMTLSWPVVIRNYTVYSNKQAVYPHLFQKCCVIWQSLSWQDNSVWCTVVWTWVFGFTVSGDRTQTIHLSWSRA